ncbi:MAG: PAS domain-containing protein, partial [Betaproteobacteria bacterium]
MMRAKDTGRGAMQAPVLDGARGAQPTHYAMDLPTQLRDTLAAVLDGNPVPTFIINADHVVIHWNRSCEAIIGVGADKVVGTREHWNAFYPTARPTLADLVLDEISTAEAREIYGDSLRNSSVIPDALEASAYFPDMGPDGRWLQFTAARIRDSEGRSIGAIETLVDVSEEMKGRQVRVKLEELVSQRTGQLQTANDDLEADVAQRERASKSARDFLAAILDSIPMPIIVKDEA